MRNGTVGTSAVRGMRLDGAYPMVEADAEVAEAIGRFLAGEWPPSPSHGV